MESAEDVRASLAVASLGDLRRHEETAADTESRVRELLAEARVLSWPLVVDAGSGLVLDGSHRAVVLARDLGARHVLVQRVRLDAPDVGVATWCRVLEGVSPAAFDRARRMLGLEVGAHGAVRCHYRGRVYTRPGSGTPESWGLAEALEGVLASNGHRPRARLVEDEAVAGWLGAPDALVLRPPAVDKASIRQGAAGALLPPKSTRFVLPYRVFGLDVPLAALRGPREALLSLLDRERARPLLCLGADLVVDRRYPERLWQFADHRAPAHLFADEAGRRAYAQALARAALPAPARPSQR
jgi:hypothetical protein